MRQPPWMAAAWRELGQHELPGRDHNPAILALYRDAGQPGITHDEVAWCAAFVGASLERAGVRSTRALNARSYLSWGTPTDDPTTGDIAVLSRGSDPALGHVGFLLGKTVEGRIILLGGNQGDAVSVAAFDAARVLAFRAAPASPPTSDSQPVDDTTFGRALAHVLEMEGGYTDDPHDPGGPTNLGITLAVWARHRGSDVTSATLEVLKAELRAIRPDDARPIYLRDYWRPCCAPGLPEPLALMHFDASVNHGVGRASRMLQQALGVAADGEIGPETLAAARAQAATPETLERYADIRRRAYRGLAHFWRFGRGWLRRVDVTLARSRTALATPTTGIPTPRSTQENEPMPVDHSYLPTPAPKWWGHSLTIWGTLLTGITTVLPVIAPLLGLELTAELARLLGDQLVTLAQAVGGLAGTLMTILGRARASAPLERRLLPAGK